MSDEREDDLNLTLKNAFRAVKDTHDGTSPNADLTLQRALLASRKNTRRRKLTQWVLVPIAAALFASTAWAGATGRLAPVVDSVREALHAEEAPTPREAPAPVAAAKTGTATAVTPESERTAMPAPDTTGEAVAADEASAHRAGSAPENVTADARDTAAAATARADTTPLAAAPKAAATLAPIAAATAHDAAPANAAQPAHATPQAETATVATAPAAPETGAPTHDANAPTIDSREAQLFAEANRIHFNERDPARALAAWDRYLAAAPNGALAPEARYNRALALIRLNRIVEARAELETFARGTYRSREARALLDALARDAGASR